MDLRVALLTPRPVRPNWSPAAGARLAGPRMPVLYSSGSVGARTPYL